ncbi:hypothetical protein, partial [Acinetobacter modestus]|uniref:hypothetical protein n=1 Tax=Acinetobacter modestus TaxID=1776740 RepID=UPI0030199E29
PVGTSRVEVKYKLQGVSQWSTLTSSAALYNNISGWYQVNLSTLNRDANYDYQYITYNAKGDILGGGQGVINTTTNKASINQKALSAEDMPSVYKDKSEVINNRATTPLDLRWYLDFMSDSSALYNTFYIKSSSFSYNLDNGLVVRKYKFGFNITKDLYNYLDDGQKNNYFKFYNSLSGFSKQVEAKIGFDNNYNLMVELDEEEFTSIFNVESSTNEEWIFKNVVEKGYIKFDVKTIESGFDFNLASLTQPMVRARYEPIGFNGYNELSSYINTSNGEVSKFSGIGSSTESGISRLKIDDIPQGTTELKFYYKKQGDLGSYKEVVIYPSKDSSGKIIFPNVFEKVFIDLSVSIIYEFQLFSLSGSKILDRQAGTFNLRNLNLDFSEYLKYNEATGEFDVQGYKADVKIAPLNYGGDGFILFSRDNVSFIDQFKPVTSASTSAKLKIRKVGTTVWENFTLSGTSDWFNWSGGNSGRDGDYEFQLDSYNGTGLTTPSGS